MRSEETTQGGAAYWLWEQEQEISRSIDDLSGEIERLEAKIVDARGRRDKLRLVYAEMRAARQLIETSGLKVEKRGLNIHVSVDPSFRTDESRQAEPIA